MARSADDQVGHAPPENIAGLAADQRQEGLVALGQSPALVHQRDADGRVLEEALEALLGQAQGLLPLALRRQVAHDGAGVRNPPVLAPHHALRDIGLEAAPLEPVHGDLAALLQPAALQEVVGSGHGGRMGEHVVKAAPALDQILRRAAQPLRQGRVDELEVPVLVHREEADRRVIHEIDELGLLAPGHLLQLAPRGDVLDAPHHRPGVPVDGLALDAAPFGGAPLLADRQLDGPGIAALHPLAQAAEGVGAVRIVGELAFERAQRRLSLAPAGQ